MDAKFRTRLAYLCAVVYFASYFTRYGVTVCLAEMLASGDYTKDLLAGCTVGLFITYGVGQLVSGWLGDRMNPMTLMSVGLFVSSLINIAVPFSTGVTVVVLWCVNGFCQALIWPPLSRILKFYYSGKEFLVAVIKVFCGSSLATIILYLISPVFIGSFGWKFVFFLTAAVGIGTTVLWEVRMKSAPDELKKAANSATKKAGGDRKMNGTVIATLALILMATIAVGMLRDGIASWLPVYVMESFNLSSSVSILSGVVLPIFNTICYIATSYVYNYKIKNEMLCASVELGIGAIALVVLMFSYNSVSWLSVLLLALVSGCMSGSNFVLTAVIPARFSQYGGMALIAGITNFAVYVGSAISTYGVSAMSEGGGWGLVMVIWLIVGVVGTLFGFISAIYGKKKNIL